MRIISGQFKARRIELPNNITARPTTDFAKEGLFNLLNNHIDFEGITVLDLFSGTGSISFEFISRNAHSVHAIEQNRLQCSFIRKTCQKLSIDNLHLMQGDVFRYLSNSKMKFDLIFADPPYDMANFDEVPKIVLERQLLNSGGIFVLEHSAKKDFSSLPHFSFHRKYGNVNFSFFENLQESETQI